MRRTLDLVYRCSCAASPRKGTKGKPRTVSLCRPGVAGGSYLGLAVPATAGNGDGTRAELNITKSIHGAQNTDLSNAPEIESRPLWH